MDIDQTDVGSAPLNALALQVAETALSPQAAAPIPTPVTEPPLAPEDAPLVAKVKARIDLFKLESLANTRLGHDTELWNHVHSALETLKADIAALLTEI